MFSLNEPSRPGIGAALGATPLRIGAGLVLLCRHVWSQLPLAFQALWNGKAWDTIDLLTRSGMPFPKFLALATALIVTAVTVGWLLGFLTRVCAFMLMPVALGALMVCNRTENPAGSELSVLYLFISVTVACFGPGPLSLDVLFRRRSRSGRRMRYNF
ncbi:MAG TPA: DoxX family protein [Verrucomicrobiaceae bacterium]|jgi:uncharacterized membrane protein YphA (DoxX/SURF4 family)